MEVSEVDKPHPTPPVIICMPIIVRLNYLPTSRNIWTVGKTIRFYNN